MENILARFPKVREPLPPEFRSVYSEHYKANRDGASKASGLAQKMESWMHRKVAEDVRSGPKLSTLEVGAGTLNHLAYESLSRPFDIVEPFHSLFESSPFVKEIRQVFDDIDDIPTSAGYDRIISIAAFEHICDLPAVVAKCGQLLNAGGCLRVGIPSEGTVLWKLGYTMTTGIEFRRKYNLDYSVLMKYEHVNTAREIETVLRHFFSNVKCQVFGVAKPLSLYQFYQCRSPRLDRCEQFATANGPNTSNVNPLSSAALELVQAV